MASDSRAVSKCVQTLPLTFHADEVGLPMYRVSESVRSTHGHDGAIVLDIRQGQMFNLNFVGSRILELLRNVGPHRIQRSSIRSSESSAVGRDRAENDAQEFLQTLKKLHLVESTDQA